MAEVHRVSVEIGGTEISFETGRMAKQASGAVVVRAGDTHGPLAPRPRATCATSTSSRSPSTSRSGCTPRARSPARSSSARAAPARRRTLTARMIDRPLRPLFPKGWRYETQLVVDPAVDRPRPPVRHPRDERRLRGADGLRHPVPDARRRGAHRQGRRQLRRQPDRGGPARAPTSTCRGRHRGGHPDGRGRRQRDPRGRDPRRARHRARRDQEALRRPAGAGREGRQGEARGRRPAGRREPLRPDPGVARRGARRGDLGRGQARAPGRDEGGRGGGAREVLRRPRGRRPTPSTAPGRSCAFDKLEKTLVRERIAVQQGAPRRPRRRRDPRRSRSRSACCRARTAPRCSRAARRRRSRVAALGTTREEMRLDNARPRDVQALLPPLQLPAVLGRGGGLHARPEAPRHRPRRARRAGARPDDPVPGGVPLHDPRRLGHPRVQRLVVDGLGVRLLAVADGRRRADQAPGRGHRDGPDQGGRRLHRPVRHRRRGGPPRRHGLQGRRHGARASPRCRWTSRSPA